MQGLQKELSRVRNLKRAAEAEIELLRSHNEEGKIHLRVNQDKDFRLKLAKKMVEESHPGYHANGYHYVDVVNGNIYYAGNTDAWNQWSDSVAFRVVAIDELFDKDSDYSPEVDWKLSKDELPYREMAIAYLEAEEEELEDNGDIPEWVEIFEVIEFARCHSEEWASAIAQVEKDAEEAAINFAFGEIKDEILIDLLER